MQTISKHRDNHLDDKYNSNTAIYKLHLKRKQAKEEDTIHVIQEKS